MTLGVRQKKGRVYGVPVAVGQVHSSDEGSESCWIEGTWLLQFYSRKTPRKGMIRNECKRRKRQQCLIYQAITGAV